MKKLRLYIPVFVTIMGICPAIAENPESDSSAKSKSEAIVDSDEKTGNDQTEKKENVNITELKELVVEGDNAWFEGNKAIFIPTKSSKNLSKDMKSMVERMNTGILTVVNGDIKAAGRSVSIFINGVPADNLDISTFWPKNALRVEYMPFSDDPKFLGKTNIVNFIIKDYIAGGLTRISASEEIPNNGDYSVSSKLVWGKMSYNAMVKGGYSRDNTSGDEVKEEYKDVWYGDKYYDLITRSEESENRIKDNYVYGGLNARYRGDKWTITHNLSLGWNENPGNFNSGAVSYSPDIISGNRMRSGSADRSLSPNISGTYSYKPGGKCSFYGEWNFNHTHNNSSSFYSDSDIAEVLNFNKENFYNYRMHLGLGYNPNSKIHFDFIIKASRSLSVADYSGSADSHQWQSYGNTELMVNFVYTPHPKFAMQLIPQIDLFDRNINHSYTKKDWLPGGELRLNYYINNKNTLHARARYWLRPAEASTRNELILRETELKWIEGNPSLRPSYNYDLSLDYYTFPLSWINSLLSARYVIEKDVPYLQYYSGGKDYPGVIGKYINSTNRTNFQAAWDIGITLLKNIRIHNQLSYDHQHFSGIGSSAYFRVRPSVSWDFGNCSIYIRFDSREKIISNGGNMVTSYPNQYGLNFTYGNGNFIFDFTADNIFKKRLHNDIELDNGPYRRAGKSYHRGRYIGLSITYTFDYGKKLNEGIDIYQNDVQSTTVLGSGER